MIWSRDYTVEELNGRPKGHIGELIGIEFTEITEDSISARMPVNEKTHQPYGILHGGASVVLAESLGSVASNMIINSDKYIGVGLEVNANHLRPVKSGFVTGICKPIHIGGKTHVWDIRLYDDRGKMNCVSRLTVAIIPKT
ncbi:MAG: esterase [Sphingobacteriales bacterium 17-39-43]|uniref:hotdog fold thioesterase n=1 Tax=Daejeonella sp. TaxID=2805397 RepID=UPI000BD10ABA|nr:hotdog fold thioesterase [Daejeonella sp.]OYY05065.1 MAG: esterase [Sphingobacteriia bacterium 35-40-5]OYZ32569.1 MAG: esterase [Sphingobacteriales bacterium 16-39-50]OZA25932.1 MAG: esterase [Sphingobacteriales bacterium 17-39-43]HQT21868.1 hotdog fold thioesterase [Daejeonella sp.]HQT57175.1 hotdog fold thioesterase [Daejeonella sp.]